MAKSIAFVILLLISPAAYAATTYTVGGGSGWTTGVNYDTWANGRTFIVGDTLVFNYGSAHSVDEVNQSSYQSCNTDNSISSFTSSPTSISLTTIGTRYFICPRSNHCSRGLKLAVTVTAENTSPENSPPPPATVASPPSQSPATPSTTTPPPPPSRVCGILGCL